MSSPHAAGCVALLVSGMKAKGIPVTPARVFKAIRATAKDVKDPQGVVSLLVRSTSTAANLLFAGLLPRGRRL
jgi:tripeptidyl-peptidase-2